MILQKDNIRIRTAVAEDAVQLTAWWNDGTVMAHAGFPLGLGTTVEAVAKKLVENSDNKERLILEWKGTPIGEMCWYPVGGGAAEIGIKICETSFQEKGIGRVALSLLIRQLFELGYSRIVLDTNLNNRRAQHVYEKLGFRQTAVHMDAWKNQVGQLESSVDYALEKEWFVDFA